MDRIRIHAWAACAVLLGTLAACAPIKPAQPPAEAARPSCTPAAAGDPLVGNWLSVSSQKGVAGALRTLYTLNADGTMSYVEQIKRPRTPSQGLYEAGCWSREGQTLVLRTLESNGSPVNLDDPIYTNRHRVERVDATELRMNGPSGAVKARRMSPGYRLPF
ncbi:hypothetical protein [Castellaniella defragrans]|jgi:hypothetical protein|uniref:Lipoprotein n=2 Tax=Castellaniella defragrans TaxID=75697 RepID=A0A7W9TQD9_CASDE|nr:hypothetical protein [Castellaniella defragrans]KAB0604900.1 hypothetical protein F7Q88_15235 [Castellaniella defragrans]MBB6084626.1 hypothetical protein [Castellaniella defragrans]CDM25972.1 putative lipoprotein [Castellaniella defragrans 65Phen]